MAKDSLLNINHIENSTIYDLPPDKDVVANDLLLIVRPNYKNKYTKRIDKDYPYEGYNSTISQLSTQIRQRMLEKDESISGKWNFRINPTTTNYMLTGNISSKSAATKWYVDRMYEKAMKKLFELSNYIYDIDHPHIPSYVGMIVTSSSGSEAKIKEIYGGNNWQLTCQNKCLVGANDLMNSYKFNAIGGNDTIKLTVKQSPVCFHSHDMSSCSVSRTFSTGGWTVPVGSGGGRAHRRHSRLHDYLIAGACVVSIVALAVLGVIISFVSGGTLAGVAAGMVTSASSGLAAYLSGKVLKHHTEFSASAISNILLGAKILAIASALIVGGCLYSQAGEAAAGTATSTAKDAMTSESSILNPLNEVPQSNYDFHFDWGSFGTPHLTSNIQLTPESAILNPINDVPLTKYDFHFDWGNFARAANTSNIEIPNISYIPNYAALGLSQQATSILNNNKNFPKSVKDAVEKFNNDWNVNVDNKPVIPDEVEFNGKIVNVGSEIDNQVQQSYELNDSNREIADTQTENNFSITEGEDHSETQSGYENRGKLTAAEKKEVEIWANAQKCPSCGNETYIQTDIDASTRYCAQCGYGRTTRSIPQIRSTMNNSLQARGEFSCRCPKCGHTISLDYNDGNGYIEGRCSNSECNGGNPYFEQHTPSREEWNKLEAVNIENSADPRTSFGTVSIGSMGIGVNIGYKKGGLNNNTEINAKTSIKMRPKYFGLYMWKRIS